MGEIQACVDSYERHEDANVREVRGKDNQPKESLRKELEFLLEKTKCTFTGIGRYYSTLCG